MCGVVWVCQTPHNPGATCVGLVSTCSCDPPCQRCSHCQCVCCLLFAAGYEGLRNNVGSAKPSKPAAVVQEDRIFSGSSTTSLPR